MRTLTWQDWSVLASAWLRLLVVDLQLRTLGVDRTARLARPLTDRAVSREQVQHARTCARWLRTASKHHPVRARCLHRSLALHHWLRAEGIPSSMDIGVAMDEGHLRAHAWVHVGNHLVGDSPADVAPFAPLTAGGIAPWR